MKYISKIILLFIVLAISSCNEEYLETAPTDQLGADEVLSTIVNQRAALEGIHRYMYGSGGSQDEAGGYGDHMINYDFLGQDVVNPQRGSGWFIAVHQWLEHRSNTSSLVNQTYNFYYTIIVNANNIINSIDNVEGS
ncbi:hypothetical protein EV198_2409, partial [Roseivirga ehrenbergii]